MSSQNKDGQHSCGNKVNYCKYGDLAIAALYDINVKGNRNADSYGSTKPVTEN
jgi:hypothetical protein